MHRTVLIAFLVAAAVAPSLLAQGGDASWKDAVRRLDARLANIEQRLARLEGRPAPQGKAGGIDVAKLAKEGRAKCPGCAGKGKVSTTSTIGFGVGPGECRYCKGTGKMKRLTGVTATGLALQLKNGTMKFEAPPLLVAGAFRRAFMAGSHKAIVELSAGEAVVHCTVVMQPNLRVRLRKLREGDQLVIVALAFDPAQTVRNRPDVHLAWCWIAQWPR